MNDPGASASGTFDETRVEVRYAESDQMGYAHHACAAAWFELGRVRWMRARGFSYRELEARGILMPVVKLNVRYHAPARFEDQLAIQTRLTGLGRSRVVFENRVWRLETPPDTPRTLLLEGRVELACVDSGGRVARLPDEIHDRFEQFILPQPDAEKA